MKYVVILAAVVTMAVGCQSQKTVAVSQPKYKPLSEVQSISMDAQNYNNKMHPMKDTVLVFMPEKQSQFKSFNEVRGVNMDAQHYNNRRFNSDTIYFERVVDSLKN
jgi:hypothetical protein